MTNLLKNVNLLKGRKMKARKLSFIAILSVLITMSAFFKLPNPFLGGEFQMSAPIAIMIAYIFGFRNYFIAGIISSIISFVLGFMTVYGIIVSMVFRVCVGIGVYIFKNRNIGFFIVGPISTFIARLALSLIFKLSLYTLLIPTIPGMIFTVIMCRVFFNGFYGAVGNSVYSDFIVCRRS